MVFRRLVLTVLLAPLTAIGASSFEQELRPMLQKTCFKCHDADEQKGGVELASTTDADAAIRKFKLWRNAIEQLETREMPPEEEKLSESDRAKLIAGLRATLAVLENDTQALRDPGPNVIRRLSRAEYNNAIRNVLGFEEDVAKAVGMPEEATGASYENVAEALQVSPALLEKYIAGAEFALGAIFPSSETPEAGDYMAKNRAKRGAAAAAALLKNVPADAQGARQVIGLTMRRAWRGPVAAEELERFGRLFDLAQAAGDPFPLALGKALKPVLISPCFLFRIEADDAARSSSGGSAVKVTDLELATRLSFFLWSSIPDEELLTLAEQQQLSAPGVLAKQVQRMLADPKAKELTENFLLRWLQLDKLSSARPNTESFPAFNDGLRRTMKEEVVTFCEKLREEDRSILELLNADYTYANEQLAKHYRLDGVTGKEFRRVALKPEDHRGGVLGMSGVLALTSHTNRTSPTLRGAYVLEVIFGTPPAPPPANVSQIDERKRSKGGADPQSFREKLALHAEDATCAGCHRKLDPLGFGLDNYDAIGGWRESGGEVDTSGELPGGARFNGAAELRRILWQRREQFARNLIAQTLQYALGRETEYFDEPQIAKINARLQQEGHRFSSLILGVVESFPFQHRRKPGSYADK